MLPSPSDALAAIVILAPAVNVAPFDGDVTETLGGLLGVVPPIKVIFGFGGFDIPLPKKNPV